MRSAAQLLAAAAAAELPPPIVPTRRFEEKKKKKKKTESDLVVVCVVSEHVCEDHDENPGSDVLVKDNVLVNWQIVVDPGAAQNRQKVAQNRDQNKGTVQLQHIGTSSCNGHPLSQLLIRRKRH
jgi:hypothetical protein